MTSHWRLVFFFCVLRTAFTGFFLTQAWSFFSWGSSEDEVEENGAVELYQPPCYSSVDVVHLQDRTCSFSTLWDTLAANAGDIAKLVRDIEPTSRFGLATFSDKNINASFPGELKPRRFGTPHDYCLKVNVPLDKPSPSVLIDTFQHFGALGADGGSGADWNEGVIEALYRLVLTRQIQWREYDQGNDFYVSRLVVLVTDARSHMEGDIRKYLGRDLPPFSTVVDSLVAGASENALCAEVEYPVLDDLIDYLEGEKIDVHILVVDDKSSSENPSSASSSTEKGRHIRGLQASHDADTVVSWYQKLFTGKAAERVKVEALDLKDTQLVSGFENALQKYEKNKCDTFVPTDAPTSTETESPVVTTEEVTTFTSSSTNDIMATSTEQSTVFSTTATTVATESTTATNFVDGASTTESVTDQVQSTTSQPGDSFSTKSSVDTTTIEKDTTVASTEDPSLSSTTTAAASTDSFNSSSDRPVEPATTTKAETPLPVDPSTEGSTTHPVDVFTGTTSSNSPTNIVPTEFSSTAEASTEEPSTITPQTSVNTADLTSTVDSIDPSTTSSPTTFSEDQTSTSKPDHSSTNVHSTTILINPTNSEDTAKPTVTVFSTNSPDEPLEKKSTFSPTDPATTLDPPAATTTTSGDPATTLDPPAETTTTTTPGDPATTLDPPTETTTTSGGPATTLDPPATSFTTAHPDSPSESSSSSTSSEIPVQTIDPTNISKASSSTVLPKVGSSFTTTLAPESTVTLGSRFGPLTELTSLPINTLQPATTESKDKTNFEETASNSSTPPNTPLATSEPQTTAYVGLATNNPFQPNIEKPQTDINSNTEDKKVRKSIDPISGPCDSLEQCEMADNSIPCAEEKVSQDITVVVHVAVNSRS